MTLDGRVLKLMESAERLKDEIFELRLALFEIKAKKMDNELMKKRNKDIARLERQKTYLSKKAVADAIHQIENGFKPAPLEYDN